jgi:hypothetical protein
MAGENQFRPLPVHPHIIHLIVKTNFLQYYLTLCLHCIISQRRTAHQVCKKLYCSRDIFAHDPRMKASVLLGCEGIDISSEGIDLLRYRHSRPCASSPEDQMLQEMRGACLGRRLVS